MARASKICAKAGCPNLQPCADHPHTPWAGSKRKQRRSLSGSAEQKRNRQVLKAFDYRCHICGVNEPPANEVDHIVPLAEGGADRWENLAPIHSKPCHQQKTAAEAKRARDL